MKFSPRRETIKEISKKSKKASKGNWIDNLGHQGYKSFYMYASHSIRRQLQIDCENAKKAQSKYERGDKKWNSQMTRYRYKFPISDSIGINPIHVVPKKGGITMVMDKNDEMIPSRLMVG